MLLALNSLDGKGAGGHASRGMAQEGRTCLAEALTAKQNNKDRRIRSVHAPNAANQAGR